MRQEWKQKWIKALRSGKYKQARRILLKKSTGGMCCLGVLCEIAKPGFLLEYEKRGHTLIADFVPTEIQDIVGWMSGDKCGELAQLNDSGKRFTTIAKKIEGMDI